MARKIQTVDCGGKLWPNAPSGAPVRIEVIGVTGEYKSGKTLFGLSIAPGVYPADHPHANKARTLYLDCEKSGGTYGGTGADRIDVPAALQATHGTHYTQKQVFEWFQSLILSLEPNRYQVIFVDPITDIESGLVDYVKANCRQFGMTETQILKSGGLLWGAVKNYWKQFLLKLAAICETFCFTAHLRDEWMGSTPTGKREPKGKDTLMELASLYLWLSREPDQNGTMRPQPSALVLKERLADTMLVDGALKIVPLLPPRLPLATVDAIRQYIAKPVSYDKLREDEKLPVHSVSEIELERVRLARAQAEQMAADAKLAIVARREELTGMAKLVELAKQQAVSTDELRDEQTTVAVSPADQQQAETAPNEASTFEVPGSLKAEGERLMRSLDTSLVLPPAKKASPVRDSELWTEPDEYPLGGLSKYQLYAIRDLCDELAIDDNVIKAMLKKINTTRVCDLTRERGDALLMWLKRKRGDGPVPAPGGRGDGAMDE